MTALRLADRPTAVYRLFAEDGELLYIGASFEPKARFGRHKDRAWGPEVTRETVKWYPNRRTALRQEALAIRRERPRYNRDSPSPETYAPRDPGLVRDFAETVREYAAVVQSFAYAA